MGHGHEHPPLPVLEVADYKDAQHWYWRLKDPRGAFLADHEVSLALSDTEYEAFLDLYGYLGVHASPHDRRADERAILDWLGRWIGEKVFGPLGPKLLDAGTPAVVRVVIPPEPEEASGLLYLPFELAHVRGKPLALQDVSLVFEIRDESPPVKLRPVGQALRMLALFSLPTTQTPLNLRRERYQLRQLIRGIAERENLAVDLRVLQYGVTRAALRDILAEADGWDIVHFSGHGRQARLILENDDGSEDEVASDDLVGLLRPARGSVKWVTLSACLSAAATIEETLRWLGIEPKREGPPAPPDPAPHKALPAVARALVRDLDCAVLAMRYPVGDDFAIALGARLYENVLHHRQPLPRALQLAIPDAIQEQGSRPLSVATPALFGRTAASLELHAPPGKPIFATAQTGFAQFPPEPERFVGRVALLSRARQALAPGSPYTGVLFHGMAGGGKTACALELARQYEDLKDKRFTAFVWFKAPEEGKDITSALFNFAQAMERQLPDLKMVHLVDRQTEFRDWLPWLTDLLGRRSILLVLDNLESLLRTNGQWRDERWAALIAALLAHRGQSRALLTSRIRPVIPLPSPASKAPPPGSKLASSASPEPETRNPAPLLSLPVHSLSLRESALLARELPNLGRLLRGEGAPDGAERDRRRELVARCLRVVQGHPKLVELAESQAVSPESLERHLDRATQAWAAGGARLDAFFQRGESTLEAADFLAALDGWTRAIVESLHPDARTLFHFLSCLEEGDRQSGIVAPVWPNLWKRLDLPGDPPDLGEPLAALRAAGLVDAFQPRRAKAAQSQQEEPQEAELYRIHPGVAEAGRAEAGGAFQAATDAELAAFWEAMYARGFKDEARGGGALVVHAGRAAAPYLIRLKRWKEASTLLERVVQRDPSPATLAEVLPLLRRIADATTGSDRELIVAGVLANAIFVAGRWQEAEAIIPELIAKAEQRGQFRLASGVAGDLIKILRATGRSQEALTLVEAMKGYTRRAGLGPWTQLADEGTRLQILNDLGRYAEVLAEVEKLRQEMKALPEDSGREEAATPWNVREALLNTGCLAALRLNRSEDCLALNAEIVATTEARGAPPLEIARTRYNDYGPLLSLRRFPEARAVLLQCRAVFEAEGSAFELGKVFTALADLENELGHHDQAAAHERTALRYRYLVGDPADCAISHFNLANYLMRSHGSPPSALVHRLAAALLRLRTSDGRLPTTVRAICVHMASFAPSPPPLPKDFEELCRTVEQEQGVHFRELFDRLPATSAPTGDAALCQVLQLAQSLPAGSEASAGPALPPELEPIRPILEQLARVAAEAPDQLEPLLASLREQLLKAAPGTEAQANALIAQFRSALLPPSPRH